jgi:hypothetical protein
VLILTPMKDGEYTMPRYWELLYSLSYPRALISLGFLEGDSSDRTFQHLRDRMPQLQRDFRRALMWKRDFGFHIPPGMDRHTDVIQGPRRSVLAKARNHLLFHAIDDEDWVLWMDVDLLYYPPDIIETLLATGKEIVQPHCVLEYGGRTFDQNAWTAPGVHMDQCRAQELVRLNAVGGTMLLIKADMHRDGLVFPTFYYGLPSEGIRPAGEIETEGLAVMARDMGFECWGLPQLEIVHQPF